MCDIKISFGLIVSSAHFLILSPTETCGMKISTFDFGVSWSVRPASPAWKIEILFFCVLADYFIGCDKLWKLSAGSMVDKLCVYFNIAKF